MPSLKPLSAWSVSDTPEVVISIPSLKRIARSQVADPVIFLEIEARERDSVIVEDAWPALSVLPLSSSKIPRSQRNSRTFLFSTRPWCGQPMDGFRANERADPRVISAGRLSRSAPLDSAIARRGFRSLGGATLANPDGGLDTLIKDYFLEGERIAAYLAEPHEGAENWTLIYEATIDRVEATRKEIHIGITNVADELKRSLQLSKFTGGGGVRGDANVVGRLKPTCWGECYGVAPVLISAADNIYMVHDRAIQAVDWVREGGVDFTLTSDYPDFDDLKYAPLAVGEYATCLARGLFRVGLTIAGLVYSLRAGIKGDASGAGYVSATGDICYRLARERAFISGTQIDATSFSAIPRGRVGYYTSGSSDVTVESVFNDLLQGAFATFGVGRSKSLRVHRFVPASLQNDDLSVNSAQLFDQRVEKRPYAVKNIQPYLYAPTFAPVGEDDISPGADADTQARLTSEGKTGTAVINTDIPVVSQSQAVLMTYFVEQEDAEKAARDALRFATQDDTAMRVELGRLGLLADIGSVIAIEDSRFATGFRGMVYEQEDSLGAVVTSRVVAVG